MSFWSFVKRNPQRAEPAIDRTKLAWRSKPGAHERHLQRRSGNLLFPKTRRFVSDTELLEARKKDDAEFDDLRSKTQAVLESMPERLPYDWAPYLHDLREHIDDLLDRCAEIGGDTTQILDLLIGLRNDMANVWRSCNKDPKALELFESAEALSKQMRDVFRGDLVHQLRRKDPCIPPDEVIPALLCEEPASVAAFWSMLGEKERVETGHWAAKIVKNAGLEGFDMLSVVEQLYEMGLPRPDA